MPDFVGRGHPINLQRGVEQVPGAAKKHLDTREFKQQQEALHSLGKEAEARSAELERKQREESELTERLQSYERQAQEAEKEIAAQSDIPPASMFNFKTALETANGIIERQKKALAAKSIVEAHNEKLKAENDKLQTQVKELRDKILGIELQHAEERQKINADIRNLSSTNQNLLARLEETEKFFRWNTTAAMMRNDYEREQRQEAQRKAEEQKRLAQEREQRERQQQEERARQAKEQERQKALEAERQRQEREQQRAQQMEQPRQGMRMR